eukprot:1148247-Pelagomonas_calceolata.AAC.1
MEQGNAYDGRIERIYSHFRHTLAIPHNFFCHHGQEPQGVPGCAAFAQPAFNYLIRHNCMHADAFST